MQIDVFSWIFTVPRGMNFSEKKEFGPSPSGGGFLIAIIL
jgi:hypothetical protein